jgi:hypothetical protein
MSMRAADLAYGVRTNDNDTTSVLFWPSLWWNWDAGNTVGTKLAEVVSRAQPGYSRMSEPW